MIKFMISFQPERRDRSISYVKGERDFPGDTVDKNLPASAGDMGSIPDQGTCHMGAHAPQLLSLRAWSLCSEIREAIAKRKSCAATRE